MLNFFFSRIGVTYYIKKELSEVHLCIFLQVLSTVEGAL